MTEYQKNRIFFKLLSGSTPTHVRVRCERVGEGWSQRDPEGINKRTPGSEVLPRIANATDCPLLNLIILFFNKKNTNYARLQQ